MKASLFLGAALAASANAGVIQAREAPKVQATVIPDVGKCGLDSFVGHTSEALLLCSSLLKTGGGTVTQTATVTQATTTTVKTTVIVTLQPPTSTPGRPTTTTKGPTTTSKPITTTTTSKVTTSPSPTPSAACGLVGYTKDTAAYYFDSSGTKNTFAACSAACKADAQCKSFGYGEANCMLFTVDATSNTNYNPMSPYTFYDAACPAELPVRKRQASISLGLGISSLSSACTCLIGPGPGAITKTTSLTLTSAVTSTQTVTRTVSLLPGEDRKINGRR